MKLVPNQYIAKDRLESFFQQAWGGPKMVVSSGVYSWVELKGISGMKEDEVLAGSVTYTEGERFEIVSLDSLAPNQGVGSALIEAAEEIAREKGYSTVYLITTNDNMHAVTFYQKRGYRVIEIHKDAVQRARRIKPSIPLKAENGIDIRDEWLLKKELNS